MKYALALLFFCSLPVQAEGFKKGGFLSFDVGWAVDSKLRNFDYPLSLSYGGSILEDRYVGAVELGIVFYRVRELLLIPSLLFKYNYDFMASSSNWALGVDTALYLGGRVVGYYVNPDGTYVVGSTGPLKDTIREGSAVRKRGINLHIGHDLGLFVKKHLSESFVILLRAGMNNAVIGKPRFLISQSSEAESKKKQDEEIKVKYEFLNPNFYLSAGLQWYL